MNAPAASFSWKSAFHPWAAFASMLDTVRGDSHHGSIHAGGKVHRVDEPAGTREPLWHLKFQLARSLAGCPDRARARIAESIAHSHTGMELWLLRAGVFQAVSIAHGEPEARRRINAILPLFEGWVPEKRRLPV